jgi:asparagine synthase (glutamine-hydrolysing)
MVIRAVGRTLAERSANRRWQHLAEWSRSIEGAWWLRRSVYAPEDLPSLMGAELAAEALRNFDVVARVRAMSGELPGDPRLALGQIESTVYLRNQLLRDSDWASMDHSVELRTPLVDHHLLQSLSDVLPAFAEFPCKRLLAEIPCPPLSREVVNRTKTGFAIPMGRWLAEKWPRALERWAPVWARALIAQYEGSV